MTADTELDRLRAQVNCAAVLENLGRPCKLDRRESSRRALKCRPDKGEVCASRDSDVRLESRQSADQQRRVQPQRRMRLHLSG